MFIESNRKLGLTISRNYNLLVRFLIFSEQLTAVNFPGTHHNNFTECFSYNRRHLILSVVTGSFSEKKF